TRSSNRTFSSMTPRPESSCTNGSRSASALSTPPTGRPAAPTSTPASSDAASSAAATRSAAGRSRACPTGCGGLLHTRTRGRFPTSVPGSGTFGDVPARPRGPAGTPRRSRGLMGARPGRGSLDLLDRGADVLHELGQARPPARGHRVVELDHRAVLDRGQVRPAGPLRDGLRVLAAALGVGQEDQVGVLLEEVLARQPRIPAV